MKRNEAVQLETVQRKIYTLNGMQVMLDSDLAKLYGVSTKVLNQAVKRNIDRFPEGFMFQSSEEENDFLRSQIVTLEGEILRSQVVTSKQGKGRGKYRKYLPYCFTEQGVAMLSAILKSDTAVKVSIQIMKAFVAMRKFILSNAQVLPRLETLEKRQIQYQIETDKKFDRVFDAIEDQDIQPKQGIFFEGQIFDAYRFVSDIIRSAKRDIILIDNYIDDSVLDILTKRKKKVAAAIFTKSISKQLILDLRKHNEQYDEILIKEFKNAHDRFLIIDKRDIYHFGASLKDLGRKWFGFSKFDRKAFQILDRLKKVL